MRLVVLLFIFSIPQTGVSQRIKNFTLYYSNTTVTAKFTVAAGSTCDGYQLLHSLDSLNYAVVFDYPGICGVPGDDLSFSAVHNNASINRNNYYKIQLSTIETSDARKIFVPDPLGPNLTVFPNPASTDLKLRIANNENSFYTAHIYNYAGLEVVVEELNFNSGLANISIINLSSGIYLIKIENSVNTFSTKLIVLH